MMAAMPDAQAALEQAVADWNRAGAAWDAQALAAVYAEDALLFGGRPGHSVGRAAIQGYFASYDGVILAGSMRMAETELRTLGPGCVLAQGMVWPGAGWLLKEEERLGRHGQVGDGAGDFHCQGGATHLGAG